MTERGRAVYNDQVILAACSLQRALQQPLALGHVDHLDFSADQVDMARHYIEKRHVQRLRGLFYRTLANENLIDRRIDFSRVDANARATVSLGEIGRASCRGRAERPRAAGGWTGR